MGFLAQIHQKSLQLFKLTDSWSSCDQLQQSLEMDVASHDAAEERTCN